MVFYHQSPLHIYPRTSLSWTPYIIATSPSACSQYKCGPQKQAATTNGEKSAEPRSKVIYQDRNTRIQHVDDNEIEFSFDLPGVKSSDIKVEIHNGVLKVQAVRKHGNGRTIELGRHFPIKEIADTESNATHASLENGVLRITVPKKVDEEKEDVSHSFLIPVLGEYPLSEVNDSGSSNDVQFSLDLPGVSLTNVTVEAKDDAITVHAMRKVFENASTIKRHFSIDTDKIDVTKLSAYLIDGVLTITGSKKEIPAPKQIVVSDGSTAATTTPVAIDDAAETKDEDDDMVVVETVEDETKQV